MSANMRSLASVFIVILINSSCGHQKGQDASIDMSKFEDGIHHWNLFAENTNYKRFAATDYDAIAENFLHFQNPDGGWPKNIDWLADINADSLLESLSPYEKQSTFDNDNTYPQIDFLSRMYGITGNEKYKLSAEKGLRYILNTQNVSGGWRGWDVDAITFNDNVTSGIMNLLLDIHENQSHYNWIGSSLKNRLDSCLQKAISVTLQCQIEVDGIKKGWCQQHDHITLLPVKARSYELPSIASKETVSILHFLMRLQDPEAEIIQSVEAAILWLEESKINNVRIEKIHIPKDTYPGQNLDIDRITVVDSTAKPIWTRYYEISDNTPFFCRRDGKKVFTLAEVNPERRGGYGWYGYWPEELLAVDYPEWKAKIYQSK